MDINNKLYNFYIQEHNKYVEKYGERVLILMLVGSFYEMYSVFDNGPNLLELSKLLNIVCTRKQKSMEESENNPKMMGFQMNSLDKFLEILTNNNYTVIVYDQYEQIEGNKKKIIRKKSAIYTKSNNIKNIQQNNNNYLISIYIKSNLSKNNNLKEVGLSCIDLSTGHVFVHSSYSEKFDEYIALDDTVRYINNINPGELLIYNECQDINQQYLYGYLNLEQNKCRYYTEIDKKYKNITFQNEFIKNIYPKSETLLTPIEQLNLEKEPNIVISLCLLFDFIYDKTPEYLKDIKYPEFKFDNSHLILDNDAMSQLDIFTNTQNTNIQTKYKCLFDVINETITPLGERYLKNILSSCFTNEKTLNEIYNITHNIQEKNISNNLTILLKEIQDIERLARKIELKMIRPYELFMFVNSYENILKIHNLLNDFDEFKKLIKNNFNKEIILFIKEINNVFEIDKLNLCYEISFDEKINIYKKNIHPEIDKINENIHSGKSTVEHLGSLLSDILFNKNNTNNTNNINTSNIDSISIINSETITIKNSKKDGNYIFINKFNIEDFFKNLDFDEITFNKDLNLKIKISNLKIIKNKNKFEYKLFAPSLKSSQLFDLKHSIIDLISKNNEDNEDNENNENNETKTNFFKIKNNSVDGYYLSISTSKAKQLQEILNNKSIIDLGYKQISSKDIKFKYSKNTAKILIPSLNDHADKLEEYVDKISDLYKLFYFEDLENIYQKFKSLFLTANDFITKIDYYNSCAIVASKKGYTRPIISYKDYSYIDAKKLRHPIVERIIDFEYIPHDISLGHNDLKGMMIYGLNSSGKSVLMKSVGLCIIMAQAGLYVPAESFTFSPYFKLMTRISGNDNIFKGLSSFGVEMSEINSILKRSNKNTLIIGDEICRGTEHISGNALVSATIIKLSKLNPSFIFTTHLHEIMTFDEIIAIKNVKAFHLKISYDIKTNALIYDRKLSEGCGEPIYGITVAKYIIQDNDFIDIATSIKNKLLNNYNSLISGKTSKYNSDVYIYECNICHTKDNCKMTNLETHHINFQKDCDKNNLVKNKKHLHKNDKANLVVLCNSCHDKIHNNELNISGFVQSSIGKVLK